MRRLTVCKECGAVEFQDHTNCRHCAANLVVSQLSEAEFYSTSAYNSEWEKRFDARVIISPGTDNVSRPIIFSGQEYTRTYDVEFSYLTNTLVPGQTNIETTLVHIKDRFVIPADVDIIEYIRSNYRVSGSIYVTRILDNE